MGKGELTDKGWKVPEDGKDSKGIPVSKVSDKDAANIAKYRIQEKQNAELCRRLTVAEGRKEEEAEYLLGLEDKVAQIEELGYTFNESGVLMHPEPESKQVDDPARS